MNIQGAKYLWKYADVAQEDVVRIAAEYNLSFALAETLLTRGFSTADAIRDYLFCSKEQAVASAALLKDAEKAVDRIIKAIKNKEKVLISGDYDVDGITSTSLMMLCLLPLGAQVNFFLPHRLKDGYGLSVSCVQKAAQSGYALMITVDNGISAYEAASHAKILGIDLIITDHHRPQAQLPPAYAIVNPNQHDCAYPHKTLAGVGVSFKLLSLLYERLGRELPAKAYELLLLGTVADVVPLVGENRFWVRHGLRQVNATESLSLQKLKSNVQVTAAQRLSSLDIGFLLAPQINALGRLEDPRDGVKFLIGKVAEDVERVGNLLGDLNQLRKQLERTVYAEVIERIENKEIDIATERVIVVTGDSWPPGVVGLVASRLVSTYGRPAIVLHKTEQGLAKGSCRSIAGFDIFAALASTSSLLEQFGGHPQAAGLSIRLERLSEFKALLEQRAQELLTPEDLQQKITIDAQVHLGDLTKVFVKQMELFEPFGASNVAPVFYVKNVSLVQKPKLLKEQHVKCQIFEDGVIKPIIFFNRPDIFESLANTEGQSFSVAAQVKENYWGDRINIELVGLDIAF